MEILNYTNGEKPELRIYTPKEKSYSKSWKFEGGVEYFKICLDFKKESFKIISNQKKEIKEPENIGNGFEISGYNNFKNLCMYVTTPTTTHS